ncbi:MAG: hypothetical protein COA32_05405 [Fluviicola sp.]|nr:MAG: hypothetical protein COA32_05405 [Fluviicola sp.]
MKKVFLLVIGFVFISTLASAKIIVQWNKSDKGLFGYNRVNSNFDGFDSQHNEYWSVDCHDPGRISCQRTISDGDSEILLFADKFLVEVNEDVDEEIENGRKNGAINQKIQRTDSNGNQVWVHIHTRWKSKGIDSDITVTTTIWETPAIN